MRLLLLLLLPLLCSSCGPSAKLNRAKAQDDIREAVFRYQFAQFQHGAERIYFLRIAGEDPSDEFMHRFSADKTPVKKASESEPGTRGVTCEVGQTKWTGEKSVEIPASYRIGEKGAARYMFFLKWDNGKWKVTRRKFLGAS
jgi:hypothetical protein